MKNRIVIAVCLTLCTVFGSTAFAQGIKKPAGFPRRPIKIIVMYPAGGGADLTARTFAKVAEQELGIDIRVENMVGGGGMVGHAYLAHQAKPDGYTMGLIANPFMFSDILLRHAPFSKNDFDPLVFINFAPAVWVVNAKSKLGDMSFQQIVAYGKKHTLQVGMMPKTMFRFVSDIVENAENIKFNFVPYDGGKQGVVALLSGDIDATTAFYSEIKQYLESGKLRAVAVANTHRFSMLPNTPTFPQLGVKMAGNTWGASRFLELPNGVPAARKKYLEKAFMKVLESKKAKAAFKKIGIVLTPADSAKTKKMYNATYAAMKSFFEKTGRIK